MIKVKVLKRALSLRRSHISDEVCVRVILDLCRDVRDLGQLNACDTIVAFFDERTKNLLDEILTTEEAYKKIVQSNIKLQRLYDELNLAYMNHLKTEETNDAP